MLKLLPALLAPAALLLPWAAVPSHLGVGLAGGAYFVHWLTKYPNLGPINWEVGAGIACLVACALLPLAFALYVLAVKPPSLRVLLVCCVACVVVYLPVLARLDGATWLLASGLDRGGAVLRLTAVLDVIAMTWALRFSARAATPS